MHINNFGYIQNKVWLYFYTEINSRCFITHFFLSQAELLEDLLSEAEQVHVRRREASDMLQVCIRISDSNSWITALQ